MEREKRVERVLAVVALATIVAAWFLGVDRSVDDLEPVLARAVPAADHFETLPGGSFAAWEDPGETSLLGYARVGIADGYGGPLSVAVALDSGGIVIGVALVDERETPSVLSRALASGLPDSLVGKSHAAPFEAGRDVDAVSGASLSVRGLTVAVRAAAREIATTDLGLDAPDVTEPAFRFGIPEVVLLLLAAAGFWGFRLGSKFTRVLRWASMLCGLLVLGFLYNDPLTLADVNRLLCGFWPSVRTDVYWYLLVGLLLVNLVSLRPSPYCHWMCPFGAAQECLGAIGGARLGVPANQRLFFLWVQRGLAWLAIVLGLLFRNPAFSSYEIFGALFDFVGTTSQFALLAAVLVLALFIRRPWCRLLCPLRPVSDYLRLVRTWRRDHGENHVRKLETPSEQR